MAEENRESRRTSERAKRQEITEPDDQAAREVAGVAAETARAGLASMTDGNTSLGPLGAVSAVPQEVTPELDKAGPAFGSFVKSIGLAVAEAQAELDKTLVTTAKALSETQIDVIAVFEQQLNDEDGTMTKGVPHVQKLPLVNYLMPTAYNWSRVYLESDMKVSQFSAASGFNIQSRSQSFNAGVTGSYGMFGGGISGSVNYGQASSSANGETSYATDSAAGSMHMEATLEPRGDIQLPKPFITQKGPGLKVLVQSVEAIMDTPAEGQPAKRIGTKIVLAADLTKSTGGPLKGKTLEFSVSQPSVTYAMTNGGKTDDNGHLEVTLERKGAAFKDGTPLEATARLWFGLVSNSVELAI